ncbi:MAG: SoxR reducing system RseC family protein [Eubacteriales bacterium]|nr:SoxR reducing system RseC family protein [Eubacteriales bacterium]
MTKFGQVTAYDEKTGFATVTFQRPEACMKCGACGTKAQTGTAVLKADCKIGDWLRVEMPEGRFLQATALAYVLPLAGLLAGIGLGYWLSGGNDLITVLCAIAGTALPYAALRWNEKRIAGRPEWTPTVTAVYGEKPTEEAIGCQKTD